MSVTHNSLANTGTSKLSALVVEDEPMVANVLAEMLAELGFEVTTAATANECLALTREQAAPSVAFIDLSLPDRSGLELISELETVHPGLQIVIATGYGSMAKRDASDGRRTPPIMCKPYERAVVGSVLSSLGIVVSPSAA